MLGYFLKLALLFFFREVFHIEKPNFQLKKKKKLFQEKLKMSIAVICSKPIGIGIYSILVSRNIRIRTFFETTVSTKVVIQPNSSP